MKIPFHQGRVRNCLSQHVKIVFCFQIKYCHINTGIVLHSGIINVILKLKYSLVCLTQLSVFAVTISSAHVGGFVIEKSPPLWGFRILIFAQGRALVGEGTFDFKGFLPFFWILIIIARLVG